MRYIKYILLSLLLSCNQAKVKKTVEPVVLPNEVKGKYKDNGGQVTQDGEEADLKQYTGKVIKSIEYCDGCAHSGDLIIITFTDDIQISIYAYKYNMQIYYK